jgi:hypothetical protein
MAITINLPKKTEPIEVTVKEPVTKQEVKKPVEVTIKKQPINDKELDNG